VSAPNQRQALAALHHEHRARWIRHVLDVIAPIVGPYTDDDPGAAEALAALVRWEDQIATPGAGLSEAEQRNADAWVEEVLSTIEPSR